METKVESFDFTSRMYLISLRAGFKTQPLVNRRFRPVTAGFYCSKQGQPPRTGRNRRSTGGWVLKPPLNLLHSVEVILNLITNSNTSTVVNKTVVFI